LVRASGRFRLGDGSRRSLGARCMYASTLKINYVDIISG
jgi:hypothetical protein